MSEDKMVRVESETAVVLDGITRAALDPNIDVAKLERLLAIQQTLLADQRRTSFRAALARLQEKLPQITKQGTILDGQGRARNKFAKIERAKILGERPSLRLCAWLPARTLPHSVRLAAGV